MKQNQRVLCAVAVTAVILVAGALAGCMTMGRGKLVEDPEGRFTYRIDPDLSPQLTDGAYDHYTLGSTAIEVYVVAVESPNEQVGRALAFDRIGRDFAALKLDGTTSFGEWRAALARNRHTRTERFLAHTSRPISCRSSGDASASSASTNI